MRSNILNDKVGDLFVCLCSHRLFGDGQTRSNRAGLSMSRFRAASNHAMLYDPIIFKIRLNEWAISVVKSLPFVPLQKARELAPVVAVVLPQWHAYDLKGKKGKREQRGFLLAEVDVLYNSAPNRKGQCGSAKIFHNSAWHLREFIIKRVWIPANVAYLSALI